MNNWKTTSSNFSTKTSNFLSLITRLIHTKNEDKLQHFYTILYQKFRSAHSRI